MNHIAKLPAHAFPWHLALAIVPLAAAIMLSACGGGGTTSVGGGGGGGSTGAISGQVSAGGTPLPGAQVSVGSGTPAVTDSGGNYTVSYNTNEVNTSTTVVVTVAKDGYQTCVGTVNTTTGTVAGCDTLQAAPSATLNPSQADAALVRVGDGETSGGTANAALQLKSPSGMSKTVALPWSAGLMPASYTTFTVHLQMRGLQSQAAQCANKVTVMQGTSAATATELKAFSYTDGNLPDSDLAGAFSVYALQTPASMFSATGGNVYVKVDAGVCAMGTPSDPADDFEFVGMYGAFS